MDVYDQQRDAQQLATYYRELQYNVAHAIQHMALINAACYQRGITLIPEHFGVVESTIANRDQLDR